MSAPFVAQLRTRGAVLHVGRPGEQTIMVRVEMPEVWDTVNALVSLDQAVMALKVRALEALYPKVESHSEFVLKLNGWEVLDESATIASVGATEGSIFLLTHRRRRPVR